MKTNFEWELDCGLDIEVEAGVVTDGKDSLGRNCYAVNNLKCKIKGTDIDLNVEEMHELRRSGKYECVFDKICEYAIENAE